MGDDLESIKKALMDSVDTLRHVAEDQDVGDWSYDTPTNLRSVSSCETRNGVVVLILTATVEMYKPGSCAVGRRVDLRS